MSVAPLTSSLAGLPGPAGGAGPPGARPDRIALVEGLAAGDSPARPGVGSEGSKEATGPTREADSYTPGDRDGESLSDAERQEVERLKARDTEVRTHEEAHKAAAGELFRGGPNYEYTTGPDGRRYATGGNVQIDTSEGRTPEETIARAQKIVLAALAPAQPSGQDRAVAAKARRMEAEARRELTEQRAEGEGGDKSAADSEDADAAAASAEAIESPGRAASRTRPDTGAEPAGTRTPGEARLASAYATPGRRSPTLDLVA